MPNNNIKKMIGFAGAGIGAAFVGYKLTSYFWNSTEVKKDEPILEKTENTKKQENSQLDWQENFLEFINKLPENRGKDTLVNELNRQNFLILNPTAAVIDYKINPIGKFVTPNDAVCFYRTLAKTKGQIKTETQIIAFWDFMVKTIKGETIEPLRQENDPETKAQEVSWKNYWPGEHAGDLYDELARLEKELTNASNDKEFNAEEVNNYSQWEEYGQNRLNVFNNF